MPKRRLIKIINLLKKIVEKARFTILNHVGVLISNRDDTIWILGPVISVWF